MAKPGNKKGVNPNQWIPKCQKNRRDGNPCQKTAMKGMDACKNHGGATPSGIDHPRIKKGGSVKFIKENSRLGEKVKDVLSDGRLMDLKYEGALLEVLTEELWERFQENEGKGSIQAALKLYEQAELALAQKNWPIFNFQMDKLGDVLRSAERDYVLINEIRQTVKGKKEVVDSITKREVLLDQMMKAEEVKMLLSTVLNELRGLLYDRLEDKNLATRLLIELQTRLSKYALGEIFNGSVSAEEPGSLSRLRSGPSEIFEGHLEDKNDA